MPDPEKIKLTNEIEIEEPTFDFKSIQFDDVEGLYILLNIVISNTDAATAANYGTFFIAPFPCQVIEAWENHKTLGSDGGAVTIGVEKLTSGQIKSNGVLVTSSTFNLKSTNDTPVRRKSSTTTEDAILSTGDRLGLRETGALTDVNHVSITVLLKQLSATIDPTA